MEDSSSNYETSPEQKASKKSPFTSNNYCKSIEEKCPLKAESDQSLVQFDESQYFVDRRFQFEHDSPQFEESPSIMTEENPLNTSSEKEPQIRSRR